jgi:triacylglycerol lipase
MALLVLCLCAAPAGASGPALSVPRSQLDAALSCPTTFPHTSHQPVLLVHGTGITPKESWGWNYGKVLPTLGYDVCTVALPRKALVDIQLSSEYVVYAIRKIASRSHRKVDVMGHSQGTIQPRWALRWWPDIRARVDDYISLAGPHHGITALDYGCSSGWCIAPAWQLRRRARFVAALNSSTETPKGPSYTSIYSQSDAAIQPTETARLAGASNILIQSICPNRYVDHAGLLGDAVVYALVLHALSNPGPARPSAAPRDTCTQTYFKGSDALGNPELYLNGGLAIATGPAIRGEPPLARYAGGP